MLEQLAAGIPTIAYDVPGPSQILHSKRDLLLTPVGDAKTMAERALQILDFAPDHYEQLSTQCAAIAGDYRWSDIAANTLREYRRALERLRDVVVFTQPFSLAAAGGGPRILRSLLRDAPVSTLAICTAPQRRSDESEIHVPLRPDFGRIERTRFNRLAHSITPLFRRRFDRKLGRVISTSRPRAIHAIAHGGLDFYSAFVLAKKFQLPFFLQVHDDIVYTGAGRVAEKTLARCMSEAWQGAAARFVISPELGSEYTKRYGEREFVIVTDGVDHVAAKARAATNQLRIYFMGLFHIGYEQNLEALDQGNRFAAVKPNEKLLDHSALRLCSPCCLAPKRAHSSPSFRVRSGCGSRHRSGRLFVSAASFRKNRSTIRCLQSFDQDGYLPRQRRSDSLSRPGWNRRP